jgi:hypothetical protein
LRNVDEPGHPIQDTDTYDAPMDRFGIAIVAIVLLAACSSGGKKSTPTPSSTLAPTSTIAAPTTSTTTVPATTTGPPPPTTPPTTASKNTGITITGFKATPNPVECNAPTMSEFQWKVSGATKVTLSIDGAAPISTFESGTQDLLLPVNCDGKTHTYTLTATNGTAKSESSISVATKKTS